jgi:protein tyrosine/serine phosphatase
VVVSVVYNRHDAEVKAHAEEDYERLHQQLEKERAMDAYRNSPAYKAKVARQMQERYGNMDKAIKDLRIP